MENGWNGGGVQKTECNMEMIVMCNAGVLDYSVHGEDKGKWTDLRKV